MVASEANSLVIRSLRSFPLPCPAPLRLQRRPAGVAGRGWAAGRVPPYSLGFIRCIGLRVVGFCRVL